MSALALNNPAWKAASDGAVETLRQVNEKLYSALDGMRPEKRRTSSTHAQELSALRHLVTRASNSLRNAVQGSSAITLSHDAAALESEKLEYLRNLEKLKRLLPDLHARLLRERSQLEAARYQLNAAATWAKARREAWAAEHSPQR